MTKVEAINYASSYDTGVENLRRIKQQELKLSGPHGDIEKILIKPTQWEDVLDIYYKNSRISICQHLDTKVELRPTINQ